MKRADLDTTTDYLVSRYNDWSNYGVGLERMRVLDIRLAVEGYISAASKDYLLDTASGPLTTRNITFGAYGRKGTGVLVAPVNTRGKIEWSKARVVPAAHIRATWLEGQATIMAEKVRRNAANAASDERRAATEARMKSAADRVEALTGQPTYIYEVNGAVQVRLDVLEKLLTLAERRAQA